MSPLHRAHAPQPLRILVATGLLLAFAPGPLPAQTPEPADEPVQETIDAALAQLAVGEYEGALLDFEDATRRAPRNAVAWDGYGRALGTVGRYDEARAAFERSIGIAPSRAAELDLAELLALRGLFDEAEALFRNHIGPGPRPDFRAHVGLARILHARGKREEAEKTLLVLADHAEHNLVEDRERSYYLGLAYQRLIRFGNAAELAMDAFVDAEKAGDPWARILVSQGDLFLEKYQGADAINQGYRPALKLDPNNVDAHVGLARAYLFRFENYKARPAVDAALAVNPHHVDALLLQAYFRFDDHDYQGAKESIDKALAVNPRSRHALAYDAAQALVVRDQERYRARLDEFAALDPHFGEGYAIIADVLALNRRFEEARELCRTALEMDEDLYIAYTAMAKYCLNTGRDEEAEKYLLLGKKKDPYGFVWRDNMLAVLAKASSFVETTTERFHLLNHVSESAVMKRYLGRILEEAWTVLTRKYRFEPEGPIRVQMFPDDDDFAVRTIGFPGIQGVLGACFGKNMTLKSPFSMPPGAFTWARTAWHEFAHVITLQLSGSRVPRWFTEGLSVYEEGAARATWARDDELDLINALANDDIIPIHDLNAAFMSPWIMFAYYQSGAICQYIADVHGFDRILRMLALYAEDKDTPEILKSVFGQTEAEFDAGFLTYVRGRVADYRVRPVISRSTVDEARRKLPRRSSRRRRSSSTEADDPAALKTVVSGYLSSRDTNDAGPYLERLVAAAPEDPTTWFLHAEYDWQRAHELGNGAEAAQSRFLTEAAAHLDKGFALGGSEYFAHRLRGELALATTKVPADDPDEPGSAPSEDGRSEIEKALAAFTGGAGEKSATGDTQRALAEFEKAKACFPIYVGPGNAYTARAKLLGSLGRPEEAMEELRAYVALEHTDFATRMKLAHWRLEKGDRADAETLLREANWIFPFDRDLHVMLAGILRETERLEGAVEELEVALELSEDDRQKAEVHVSLAEVLLELGQFDAARAEARAAIALDPDCEPAQGLLKKLP